QHGWQRWQWRRAMSEDDLKAEIAALKERLAALEARGRPAAPMRADPAPLRDLTAGMSMPREALLEMATAVPTVVIRQIVTADRVKGELPPFGPGNANPPLPRSRHTTPAPLDVPGIALADRIVDAQDARDRADLIEREAKRLAQTKTDNAA